MATSKNQPTPDAAVADEANAPALVEGRCNAIVHMKDGSLDRCSRPADHSPNGHVGWQTKKQGADNLKARNAEFAAWRRENDPAVAAKEAERHAKKMATLEALAEELGFTLAPKA